MKKILTREQYLDTLRTQRYGKYTGIPKSNEALANDVNWGDSLLGRLVNSLIRKAGIGIDLKKMDNVINRLKEQFELLKSQIKIKNDLETNLKLFYIHISVLLGKLIKEIENESNSISDISKSVDSVLYDIEFDVLSEDSQTKKEKEIVIKKLKEFLEFLKEFSNEESKDNVAPKAPDEKEEVIEASSDFVPGTRIPKTITLALTAGQSIKPLEQIKTDTSISRTMNLDIQKIDIKELPNVLLGIDSAIKILHNSLMSNTTPPEKKVIGTNELDLKKLYRELVKKAHPDNICKSGLTEETANEYFKRLNNLNEMKDLEGMRKFQEFINLIIKEVELRYQVTNKLEELSKRQTDFTKDSDEQLESKLKNEKYKNFWPKIREILDKRKSKKKSTTESLFISSYDKFILEKLEVRELREKFDSIFDEEFMKKYQVTKDPSELEKEFESKENTITIDPIIEIVKIFNRAYKLHTPGIIPSGRKGGKVSNKVYREYDYVGKGSDSARMATEGGVEPGMGPYRNKALFNKWENAVLDIIKDPKYQEIFNENTYFHFSPADPRYNTQEKKEGGGKALLKFINQLLDGKNLYMEGAQSKFIEEYFDVKVDSEKLGYTRTETSSNSKIAADVKGTVNYVFKPFDKTKIKNIDGFKNLIFKTTEERNTWFLKVNKVIGEDLVITMTNGFPYDLKLKTSPIELSESGKIWLASSSKSDFENNKINKKRLETPDVQSNIRDWQKNETEFQLSKFEVLVDEETGEFFKDESKMKKDKHKDKDKMIEKSTDRDIKEYLLK